MRGETWQCCRAEPQERTADRGMFHSGVLDNMRGLFKKNHYSSPSQVYIVCVCGVGALPCKSLGFSGVWCSFLHYLLKLKQVKVVDKRPSDGSVCVNMRL